MSICRTKNRAARELNQGGTSTSAIVFVGSDGTSPALLPLDASGVFGNSSDAPGSVKLKITAWGRVTGGSSAVTYTATLQYGTSATASSNTTIEASTARTVTAESENWDITAEVTIDQDSGKMNGRGWAQVGNAVDSVAALDNQVTGIDLDSNSTLGFVVAGTFGTNGQAANAAYLDGFVMERIG